MNNIRTTQSYAYITLLIFLLSSLLPFFAVYNFSSYGDIAEKEYISKEISSIFGSKILICTSEGFKWVSQEDLQNGSEKPTPHPKYKCAACYVSTNSIKYLSDFKYAEIYLEEIYTKISYDLNYGYVVSNIANHLNNPTRAPPSFIIA